MTNPTHTPAPSAKSTQPTLQVAADGTVVAPPAARHALAERPGAYTMLRAGDSVWIMSLDEGTGSAPKPGEAFVLAGDLSSLALLGLLPLVAQARLSGRLVVKRNQEERVVLLKDGDIASVGSNAAADRLGQFLIRRGTCTREQIEQAMSRQSGGHRLGKMLQEMGVLDAHELWNAIQAQITEIVADVVLWERGSYVLYAVPEDFRFPRTPTLSLQGLLLEAVRRADEMGVFRTHIKDIDTRVERVAGRVAPADDTHASVFAALSAPMSVSALTEAAKLGEFDTTKALYEMVESGHIRVCDAPDAQADGLSPTVILQTYNDAFREIYSVVVTGGFLEPYLQGVSKYLFDSANTYHALFRGIALTASGELPAERLLGRLDVLAPGPDPCAYLRDALNDLTFFTLFQCGEMLDSDADDALNKRVREIQRRLPD